MCSAYLQKGSLDGRHVARVAWETVTTPKAEGGLGLKNILVWNKSCMFKLLWMLFFKTDSVWVAWIQDNVIKRQVLLGNEGETDSHLAFQKVTPGNGYSISFWHSPWLPFGPLIHHIGSLEPRQSGISLSSTLSTLWNRQFLDPLTSSVLGRRSKFMSISHLSPYRTPLITQSGTLLEQVEITTTSSLLAKSMTQSRPKVMWNKAMWFSKGIPKHKTLNWLFLLDRCPTRDRLISWGLATDPSCLLCNNHQESRNHLFFGCTFTRNIWRPLLSRLGLTASDSWDDMTPLTPSSTLLEQSITFSWFALLGSQLSMKLGENGIIVFIADLLERLIWSFL